LPIEIVDRENALIGAPALRDVIGGIAAVPATKSVLITLISY
jgi:hypothetical protein